ncbi:endolytic transglycosylase MltG [Streptomyces sp. NPDC002454]
MQTKTPQRRSIRLTRRGRIALVAITAAVIGSVVALPVVLSGEQAEEPTSLTIPVGWRAEQVYTAIDKVLALRSGTTKKELPAMKLPLPAEAKGNPEGYLFPATYPTTEDSTPRSLLSQMVDATNEELRAAPLAAGANSAQQNGYRTVTIASIVQAESGGTADMGKVARVIHNRMQQEMPLQLDSTIDYVRGQNTGQTENHNAPLDNPYNTYARPGLPPTPISSPSKEAMRAAIAPTPGDWLYFVTVKSGDTRFTAEYQEHQRNVAELKENRQRSAASASP